MEELKEKLQIVNHYMNNINDYSPDFWENLKSTKLKGKTKKYINDVSSLIDEWIDYGKDRFYYKYNLVYNT